MALSKAERVARAKLAAHESWASTTDRTQRTAAARKASPGSVEYWLDRVDPNNETDPVVVSALPQAGRPAPASDRSADVG